MMNGLLVVGTEEVELLFEMRGRICDYVPPDVQRSGQINTRGEQGRASEQRET